MKKLEKSTVQLIIGGALFSLLLILLMFFSFMKIFRHNPYGEEIRIDNLADKYPDLPQNERDMISNQLYDVVAENVYAVDEIPESGAFIRDGSDEHSYDGVTRVHYGSFVVDIDKVKQSYLVQFEWSTEPGNKDMGGYPVVILCVPESLRIYTEQVGCQDIISEPYSWGNEYQLDYSFGESTSYKIRETVGDYLRNGLGDLFTSIVVGDGSLMKLSGYSDIVYSFDVVTDNSNAYHVIARTDVMYGKAYIVILIVGEVDGRVPTAFIFTDSNDRINELSYWVRNTMGYDQATIDSRPLYTD